MPSDHPLEPFKATIEAEIQALEEMKRRKGEIPLDRESSEELRRGFIKSRFLIESYTHFVKEAPRNFIMPEYYSPCTTSAYRLDKITIAKLKLETHHTRTCLKVRAITAPIRVEVICFLVEDENEDVTCVCLQQQDPENVRCAEDIVSEGDVLLLKQPYFTCSRIFRVSNYGIRVDHLSDIETLQGGDDRIPAGWRPRITEIVVSADDLKKEGNELLQQNKYGKAVKKYTHALTLSNDPNEKRIISRNRALANLKLRRFDAALADAGYPDTVRDEVISEKALFRAAEALYHLGRYEESVQVLEALCKEFPENKQASKTLQRAQTRLDEQHTGTYDFKRMQQEAMIIEPPLLDHATYIGPVEVRQAGDNKGRGLFLTRAVKAGDLLICEKAFGYASTGRSGKGNAIHSLLMDTTQSPYGCSPGAQPDLLRTLVQKMSNNPSQFAEFQSLSRGAWKAKAGFTDESVSVVDTFLVQQITIINAFGCPQVSTYGDIKPTRDAGRINSAFGICLKVSYANHDCLGNATTNWIGDMCIMRAARDMDAGAEVLVTYKEVSANGSVERGDKMRKWGFQCDCKYCEDARDTNSSVFEERNTLRDQIARIQVGRHGAAWAKVEPILAALEATYRRPAHEVPRLLYADVLYKVADLHFGMIYDARALASCVKFLESLGFIISGWSERQKSFTIVHWGHHSLRVVLTFMTMQTIYKVRGEGKKVKQAQDYARTMYRIFVGEHATFDEFCKDRGF